MVKSFMKLEYCFEVNKSQLMRSVVRHLDQMRKGKPCDLVVCWENDAQESPKGIEVLELKEIIKGLPKETT